MELASHLTSPAREQGPFFLLEGSNCFASRTQVLERETFSSRCEISARIGIYFKTPAFKFFIKPFPPAMQQASAGTRGTSCLYAWHVGRGRRISHHPGQRLPGAAHAANQTPQRDPLGAERRSPRPGRAPMPLQTTPACLAFQTPPAPAEFNALRRSRATLQERSLRVPFSVGSFPVTRPVSCMRETLFFLLPGC